MLSVQAKQHLYIHTCIRKAVTLVWGSLRLAPLNLGRKSCKCKLESERDSRHLQKHFLRTATKKAMMKVLKCLNADKSNQASRLARVWVANHWRVRKRHLAKDNEDEKRIAKAEGAEKGCSRDGNFLSLATQEMEQEILYCPGHATTCQFWQSCGFCEVLCVTVTMLILPGSSCSPCGCLGRRKWGWLQPRVPSF